MCRFFFFGVGVDTFCFLINMYYYTFFYNYVYNIPYHFTKISGRYFRKMLASSSKVRDSSSGYKLELFDKFR